MSRYEDDQYRYSIATVEDVLPAALDPDWAPEDDTVEVEGKTGKRGKRAPGEWGNTLAIVMDVRRALRAGYCWPEDIADFLNGETDD